MRKTIIKCQSKFSDENLLQLGACQKQHKLFAHYSLSSSSLPSSSFVPLGCLTTNNHNVRYWNLQKVLCICLLLFINSRIRYKRNKIKNKVFSIRIKLQSVIEKTLYLDTIYEREIWWKSDYDQINVSDNSNHFPPLCLRISFARHKMTTILQNKMKMIFATKIRN